MQYCKIFALYLLLLTSAILSAQTIKGTVVDADTEIPIIGATVELLTVEPVRGAVTDIDGEFILDEVPAGRHELRIGYLGYGTRNLPNLLVTVGKETVIRISLEEDVESLGEVVVSAKTDPSETVNELAGVSARSFTTEQVNRFAGGRADVSRLVSNLAGVATADDSRNDIVIRGNSPTGLLWQLEGIPIPNPNHFSTLGTTGGPVSALNPNLLATSDFSTSAFSAEFGNALSGVFDLQFRSGNRDKFEFMGQLGTFSGLEAVAEGPMGEGSFVVGFRNSFVEFAEIIGIPVGTNATPNYRDLSFKLDFANGRAGKFSLFGIGGTSDIDFLGNNTDADDLFADPSRNAYPRSRFAVLGLRHNLLLNDKSYLRTVVSGTYQGLRYTEFLLDNEGNDGLQFTDVTDDLIRYSLKTFLNTKRSARLTTRIGLQVDLNDLTTLVDDRNGNPDLDGDGLPDLQRNRDYDGQFLVAQAFALGRYKFSNDLSLNAGLHAQHFTLTEATALEPRLALRYQFRPRWELSLGYGRHSQTPPLPVFLYRDPAAPNADTNLDLGFIRADHYVLASDWSFAPDWHLKTELFYQHLFDVPVDAEPSSFSILNAGADFIFPERGNLVSEGTGRNYGFEWTLEKYFRNDWYAMLTGSVFESRYTPSDGVERNTAFNNRYVTNLVAGREWSLGQKNRFALTVDTKLTNSGGRYYTPTDLELSRQFGIDVRDETRAFTERYTGYFRWDLKFGLRVEGQKRKFSQSWFLDLQNLTNNDNVFARRYNSVTGEVNTVLQSGFFPDVQYRVTFYGNVRPLRCGTKRNFSEQEKWNVSYIE